MLREKESQIIVDSDSESSQDDGQYQRDQNRIKKQEKVDQLILVGILIIGVSTIIIIFWMGSSRETRVVDDISKGKKIIQEHNITQMKDKVALSLIKQQGHGTKDYQQQSEQQHLQHLSEQKQPTGNFHRQDLQLKPIQYEQVGDILYLTSSKDKGTIHWLKPKQLVCKSDQIINSGVKIRGSRYAQATVYQHLNCLYYNITIPAENIYSLEPIQQFLKKLSKKQDHIIAYDHSSPLLLMISAIYSHKGLFVVNDTNWELFEQNFVLNDLLPLANPVMKKSIVQNQGFTILVTDELSLVRKLLFEDKRELIIILEITSPLQVDTYLLRKLKVYRFQEKQQCQPRAIEIYEPNSWRIEQKIWLLKGWYVITIDTMELKLQLDHKNYENKLYKHRDDDLCVKCNLKNEYPKNILKLSQNYVIESIPYKDLYLIKTKDDQEIDREHYQQIATYLTNHKDIVRSKIYLHSGSYYLMMIIVAIADQNSEIIANKDWKQYTMLNKNLVLNNLQRLSETDVLQSDKFGLIVTNNLQKISKIMAEQIIFVTQTQSTYDANTYQAYKVQESQQCTKSVLSKIQEKSLQKGVYLLIKNTKI